jgi:hypothetical protein
MVYNDLIEVRLRRRKKDIFWINQFHTPTWREELRSEPLVGLVLGKKQPLVCPVDSDLEQRRVDLKEGIEERSKNFQPKEFLGGREERTIGVVKANLFDAIDHAAEGDLWQDEVGSYLTSADLSIDGGLPEDIIIAIYDFFCEGIQVNGLVRRDIILQGLDKRSKASEHPVKIEIDCSYVEIRERYAREIQGAAQYCQLSE